MANYKDILKRFKKTADRVLFYSGLLVSVGILIRSGYHITPEAHRLFGIALVGLFYTHTVLLGARLLASVLRKPAFTIARYSELVLFLYFLAVSVMIYHGAFGDGAFYFAKTKWIYMGFFALVIIELSRSSLFFDQFYFNPTLLFVLSFLALIVFGTALLLLPRSTTGSDLSFVNALFMSTSAVCITGLSVVDISRDLTGYGQTVLILLVQLGGLGILTFTGFFGYFFTGGFSYKSQLMYTELLGEGKTASVIKTLLKIVFITLLFEGMGAVAIYLSVDAALFENERQRVFFAVFHAISGFCNAGFSTLPDGYYNSHLRFNYIFLLFSTFLFVLGGLGFGIMFNVYNLLKKWTVNLVQKALFRKPFVFTPWIIGFNSRLIAYVSALLLAVGTLSFLLLEYSHTLREHESLTGKLVTSFFMGASPRSAGMNAVRMEALSFPTVLVLLLLMWIGAAPASTGGGIKTTTFAVLVLNITALIRGKDRVEVFGREISPDSLKRAFAIVGLSLASIGISIFCLSVTDGGQGLLPLAFESFSAYGTVGLSLGVTPLLSDAGKLMLALTMFSGRVGTLTLLIALVRSRKPKTYRYPEEQVIF